MASSDLTNLSFSEMPLKFPNPPGSLPGPGEVLHHWSGAVTSTGYSGLCFIFYGPLALTALLSLSSHCILSSPRAEADSDYVFALTARTGHADIYRAHSASEVC